MPEMKLNVEGMTCQHCQKAVKEALERVSGVEQAEVDLERGEAVVYGATDAQLLIRAVEEEGYSATLAQ